MLEAHRHRPPRQTHRKGRSSSGLTPCESCLGLPAIGRSEMPSYPLLRRLCAVGIGGFNFRHSTRLGPLVDESRAVLAPQLKFRQEFRTQTLHQRKSPAEVRSLPALAQPSSIRPSAKVNGCRNKLWETYKIVQRDSSC